MEGSVLLYVVSMGGYFLLLLGTVEFLRRRYKFSHYLWLASLLTIPFWLGSVEGWFRWFKMLSVLIPIIILGFTRIANYEKRESFWRLFRKNWVLYFFFAVLNLNILEATLKDISLGNYFNAIAGVILIVTVPFPIKYWIVSEEKYGDVLGYVTLAWAFLYTTWNACFVYGESPAYFFSSCCILMAAVVYPLIVKKPELYLTSRIYTLIIHLILRATFPEMFLQLMDASRFHSVTVLNNWGILNAVLALAYLVWYVVSRKRGTYRADAMPLRKA